MTRAEVSATIDAELAADHSYRDLAARSLRLAETQAKAADVRGLEQLVDGIHRRDQELGGTRPDTVNGLLMTVEAELDAARRLRLARDRWAFRIRAYRKYPAEMRQPVNLFASLKRPLEDIKSLAGSTPETLQSVRRAVSEIQRLAQAVHPPEELRATHALLVSASQLADQAARLRREATLSGDMAHAWDASSAAAGALMLVARARTDLLAILVPPQLR